MSTIGGFMVLMGAVALLSIAVIESRPKIKVWTNIHVCQLNDGKLVHCEVVDDKK